MIFMHISLVLNQRIQLTHRPRLTFFLITFRDALKFYYVDKECSESDAEAPKDTQSQPGDDHSHVHFSLDTSYKVKCEVNIIKPLDSTA